MGNRAPRSIAGRTLGNWDKVKDLKFCWAAQYENGRFDETGMVPLENYTFFSSLESHFHDGLPWSAPPWLQWMIKNSPSRYKTKAAIERRLSLIETLYEACKTDKFRQSWHAEEDLPLVNIGREGRIAIEDGRHRICVAKVARLAQTPVRLNAIHPAADLKVMRR